MTGVLQEDNAMWLFDKQTVPQIRTALPGPKARELLERDARYMSPSYTRIYPLVVERGSGAVIQDVDGNLFLDFTAGIAVTSTGHCHPRVTAAIADQAHKLLHMSGTDFYYQPQIDLAQRLAESGPGTDRKRVFFTNSGAEALEAALKLARRRGFAPLVPDIHHVPYPRGCPNCDPAGGMCECVRQIEETVLRRTAP